MKNYKVKTSFVNPERRLKSQPIKTGIKSFSFILISVENCLQFDAIHDFYACLRTVSNPLDIYRFRIQTGKIIIILLDEILYNRYQIYECGRFFYSVVIQEPVDLYNINGKIHI